MRPHQRAALLAYIWRDRSQDPPKRSGVSKPHVREQVPEAARLNDAESLRRSAQ